MNPVYQPTNWFDLIPYILIAIPAIIAAYGTMKTARVNKIRHRENRENIQNLKYEITNDHESHIRHDIDHIRDLLRDGFSQTQSELDGLRRQIRAERRERIEADRLLRLVKGGDEFDLDE